MTGQYPINLSIFGLLVQLLYLYSWCFNMYTASRRCCNISLSPLPTNSNYCSESTF